AEGGTVMVVLNTSGEDRQLDLARFQERILDHTTGTDVVTGAAYSLRQPLAVGAREALVLELSQ
ncbi:MAG: cyclomaltodextrinase C-terminal domain-containing protein, partial [Bacteroidota bacterium]